jgi:hypothetical protein
MQTIFPSSKYGVVDGIASGGISAYIESPCRQVKNINMYQNVLTSSSNKI